MLPPSGVTPLPRGNVTDWNGSWSAALPYRTSSTRAADSNTACVRWSTASSHRPISLTAERYRDVNGVPATPPARAQAIGSICQFRWPTGVVPAELARAAVRGLAVTAHAHWGLLLADWGCGS